jgi:NitT/TauT family transport system substrate-binding protein
MVTVKFLSAHPAMVTALLKGHVQGSTLLNTDRAAAQASAAAELTDLFGRTLPAPLLTASFAQVTYTNDPLASSMLAEARNAAAAGLLTPPGSLAGLFDLAPLNTLLRAGRSPYPDDPQ